MKRGNYIYPFKRVSSLCQTQHEVQNINSTRARTVILILLLYLQPLAWGLAGLTRRTIYWMNGWRHGVLVRVTSAEGWYLQIRIIGGRIICKGTVYTGEGSNSRGAVITQNLGRESPSGKVTLRQAPAHLR